MTHVKLMGEMGDKFGSEWECVDTNMRDILKCINVQTEGLQEYLLDCHLKNIEFSVQSGDNLIEEFPELSRFYDDVTRAKYQIKAGADVSDVLSLLNQ